jgi:hypothetical protein
MPLTTGPGTISVAISLGANRPRGFHASSLEFFIETLAAVALLSALLVYLGSIEIRRGSPDGSARRELPSWFGCPPSCCSASASKFCGMAPSELLGALPLGHGRGQLNEALLKTRGDSMKIGFDRRQFLAGSTGACVDDAAA